MTRKTQFVIEREDAVRYKKSLVSIRRRMISAAQGPDMGFRKWADRHLLVLDELINELR